MTVVYVHPATRAKNAKWVYTHVSRDIATRGNAQLESPEAVTSLVQKMNLWPESKITVLKRPWNSEKITLTHEDSNLVANRVESTEDAIEDAPVPAKTPTRRQRPSEQAARAQGKEVEVPVLPTGFDPAIHYGVDRVCQHEGCSNFIEKTGNRGRPPANCNAHRGEKKTIVARKESQFGPDFYANPCAGPGKEHGVPREKRKGAQPKYCQRVNCQKARAKALAKAVKS
jgi:Rieske Fe-S protein